MGIATVGLTGGEDLFRKAKLCTVTGEMFVRARAGVHEQIQTIP